MVIVYYYTNAEDYYYTFTKVESIITKDWISLINLLVVYRYLTMVREELKSVVQMMRIILTTIIR